MLRMILLLLGIQITTLTAAVADEPPRTRTNFDAGWRFLQKNVEGFEKPTFDDAAWQELTLPHDWSIEGEYSKEHPMGDRCGYLPAGVGLYRKTIAVPETWKGKRVRITFDGVFQNSTVWANGKKLGFRPYGWISFSYDLTDAITDSDRLTLAVHVDNTKQPAARWYTGSGIYAPTWITVTDKVYIPESGLFIKTEGFKEQSEVTIATELTNDTSEMTKVLLRTQLLSPAGKAVASAESQQELPAGRTEAVSQKLTVKDPKAWSLDTPVLYTAVSEVLVGGQVVDRVKTRFGIRDIAWKTDTGFWLNGKNVKLRGICNHQDAGPLGAAVPDKILRYRIQQLKDMGCNAIRTAHNPQTPVFYDICDELGMLVMDEIFDGWGKKAEHDYGAYHFAEWWKRDVADWIRRDRNHPCIVIYSVGNETRGTIAKALVEHCHSLDATRPVTSGSSNQGDMDVYGENGHSEVKGYFDKAKFTKPFVGTENPHTWQVRGYYRTKTWYRDGQKKKPYQIDDLTDKEIFVNDWANPGQKSNGKQIFNSSYDNATVRIPARAAIAKLRDIPYYAGQFRWTGHDYIGEAGYVHGGWPFKAFMGGAIDLSNFEKDLYYLYQSQWTTKPMVHILPHWTHPKMKLGTAIPVWVYSNCDRVELFLNGKSLGTRTPGGEWEKMQCQWLVPWTPGEIKAVAYKNGTLAATKVERTASTPSQIHLSVDGEAMAEKTGDIIQLRVASQDAQGNFYPYGENRTYFHILGPARIKALGNGSPVDVERHVGVNSRVGFYGLTRAFIESTADQGDIAVIAASILGEKRQLTSKEVSIDVEQLDLRGKVSPPKIEIYYTTDGSTPSKEATPYKSSFTVSLGTTVKAVVLTDGKPILNLEERFAENEGFSWTQNAGATPKELPGEQAEQAKFNGGVVKKEKKGFRGSGYLAFSDQGGQIEWYLENDGPAEKKKFVLRFSRMGKKPKSVPMELLINGKSFPFLPKPNGQWQTRFRDAELKPGANTVVLKVKGAILIDELSLE